MFNYYFKTDSFSTNLKGEYHEEKRWLELYATPIVNYKAKNKNGADCDMDGDFTLMASLLETTLTGQFNPVYEHRLLCPAITIKFVKYVPDTAKQTQGEMDEDDTTEIVNPVIVKKDSVKPLPVVRTPVPVARDTTKPAAPANPIKISKDTSKPLVKIEFVKPLPLKKDTMNLVNLKPDTLRAKIDRSDTIRPSAPIFSSKDSSRRVPVVIKRPVNSNEKYIRELYRRTFQLVTPVMEVEADSLNISFYDNGEIDNDTISVFYNRKPILLSQMLSDKPITLRLRLDTSVNEISMFAENLGRIPPNTAVAVIYVGDQRFELSLSSSLMSNATVRFRKKTKVKDPKNVN